MDIFRVGQERDVRRIDGIKISQIIVAKVLKGSGTDEDPIRAFAQLWSMSGDLIAEIEWNNDLLGYYVK